MGYFLDGMPFETYLGLTIHDRIDIALAIEEIVASHGPLIDRPKTLNRKL